MNSTISAALSQPGEQDQYTFILAKETRVVFDALTNVTNLNWTLTGPNGTPVDHLAFSQSDSLNDAAPVLLLPAGTFTITIDVAADLTTAYSFRLLDLPRATAITTGSLVT